MPVIFYEFGQNAGTVVSGESSGTPETYTGTLGPGMTTISFSAETLSIEIHNSDDAEPLEVSLDGGVTWLPLEPYDTRSWSIAVTSIVLRPTNAGETPSYDIVGIVGSA